MPVSTTILFDLTDGKWEVATGADQAAHRFIVSRIYGGLGKYFHTEDGDTQFMIDIFGAFGFTIRFVGGTTDV